MYTDEMLAPLLMRNITLDESRDFSNKNVMDIAHKKQMTEIIKAVLIFFFIKQPFLQYDSCCLAQRIAWNRSWS